MAVISFLTLIVSATAFLVGAAMVRGALLHDGIEMFAWGVLLVFASTALIAATTISLLDAVFLGK